MEDTTHDAIAYKAVELSGTTGTTTTVVSTGFSKSTILIIIGVIFLIVAGYIYFAGLTPSYTKETEKEIKQQNQILDKRIDSLANKTDSNNIRINNLEQTQVVMVNGIAANNDQIVATNKKLLQIQKSYAKQINAARVYTVRDIDSFFANRYQLIKK